MIQTKVLHGFAMTAFQIGHQLIKGVFRIILFDGFFEAIKEGCVIELHETAVLFAEDDNKVIEVPPGLYSWDGSFFIR